MKPTLNIFRPVALLGAGLLGWTASAQTNAPAAPSLPPIEVHAAPLREEQAVGPYAQPEWTTARRFPTTRVYLQQTPWDQGVEGWWRGQWFKDGTSKHRYEAEYELGLPGRMQLDLYHAWATDQEHVSKAEYLSAELRYALADWGKIPLNPTLYGEAKYVWDGPNVLEGKLLLGDQFGQRIHWGVNFVWEEEAGGERERELAVSQAASFAVIDQRLSLGYEWQYYTTTVAGDRAHPEKSLVIGPSLQWRPTANTHLDFVPMFGVTEDAPRMRSFVVFGFDFGPARAAARQSIAPTALRGR
ncbi:MAG: hypothetical protein NTV49_11420 [Kiritimatiellaeota bacterium]|nr:hypothetical protein [Kiritimatiellota bacterium]